MQQCSSYQLLLWNFLTKIELESGKTSLKLAASRLKLMKNKKEVQSKQMKKELAQLLESEQDQTARIRVEHVVREEKTMAAYDLLEIYCELIVARLPIIESQKNCPIDLKEAITSVIFASPRCADIPELMDVRKHFTTKYGKEFITAAVELRPECGVSRMLVEKLSAMAPDGQTKIKILSAIAEEHNIKWEPKSFGEKELKPPDDLLNGPNTFEKASKMHTEPPIVQAPPPNVQAAAAPNVQDPPGPYQKHNAPVNFDQYARSSTSPQNFASTGVSGDQTTKPATYSAVRPSGTLSERMEVWHSHSGDGNTFSLGKQNWNMEFKDATAAAQAAAESAERASMAARAAAELSSRGKIARQNSTESQNSDIHGLRDEGPRRTAASKLPSEHFAKDSGYNSFHDRNPQTQTEQVDRNEHVNPEELAERFYRDGHGSTKRSSWSASLRSNTASIDDDKLLNDLQKADGYSQQSSFEEEDIKAEKSAFFSEMSTNKQSRGSDVEFVGDQQVGLQSENFNYFGEETIRKQASNVSSHSHPSNHGDDYDVPHYSHHNFGIDAGEDTFVGIDQGNIHGDTVQTSSYNNAAVVFDESDSDDDDFRFDTRPGYDEQESRLYSTSPGRESAAHLSGNTDTWRTRQKISESLDKSSSLSRISAEWRSSPETNESLTKSAHPSQPDDLLPVNFDDSDGTGSGSEDELDMSRLGGKTDPSILPRKQNIYFRNPGHIQRESHGLTGSSFMEKGDSGSNRKQDLLNSSDDEEDVVSAEKNQVKEFSAPSSRKFGFDEVPTHQSSSTRTKSRLASNDMASKPFYNPVEEGKLQETPQSSRLSLAHEVKAPDKTCTPDLPDTMKDDDFFDQSSLESVKELKFGTLRGGLRNKGNRRPAYIISPSSDVSSSSKKAAEDNVTTIEHSTAFPAAKSSLNSGVSTRVKYESSSPIPRKDSDTDDSEEELPQQTSRRKQETYNPKASKEVNTKSRFRAPVTYFDSDDGDSEEDLPKQTVTSTGRAGSGLSRRTKATPSSGTSSYLKTRVSSGASVNSDADAEKISSRSSYGSETPPKPRYQTVNTGDWGSSSEPSAAKQATSKPMPDSSISMRGENLKSSVMEQQSSPLKTVASGSTENPKASTSSGEAPSRESSLKKASHVHPKLPDYDSIAAQLESLRANRQ